VPLDVVGSAVGVELADARSHHGSADKGAYAAHHVHHARAGEVAHAGGAHYAQGGKPAAAPDPFAVYGVDKRPQHKAVGQVGGNLHALGHGPGHNGGCRRREDHLEEPHHGGGNVIAFTRKEKAGISEKAVAVGKAREKIGAAEHEGEAEGPEGQRTDAEVHEALGPVVNLVLGADKPRAQEGESELHKPYQEAGDKRPGHVDGQVRVGQ
jgi:hypothetical protein